MVELMYPRPPGPQAWAYRMTDRRVEDPTTWRPVLFGPQCTTTHEFLSTAAHALEFPGYFGGNWDAFVESLRDLLDLRDGGIGAAFGGRSGRSERRVQLVIRSPELVLHESPLDALRLLVTILRASAAAPPTRRGPGSG